MHDRETTLFRFPGVQATIAGRSVPRSLKWPGELLLRHEWKRQVKASSWPCSAAWPGEKLQDDPNSTTGFCSREPSLTGQPRIQADYEERQASQSGRLAFNKRKLKGTTTASTAAAGGGGAGGRGRRPGVAVPPGDAGHGASGKAALRGAGQHGSRGGATNEQAGGEPDTAQPAPKKAKRAVLSFGDDSDEDGE